jgi:hypothetical protein
MDRQGGSRANVSEVVVGVDVDSTASNGRLLHFHTLTTTAASIPNAHDNVYSHLSLSHTHSPCSSNYYLHKKKKLSEIYLFFPRNLCLICKGGGGFFYYIFTCLELFLVY